MSHHALPLAIVGPTAAGKSALALAIARIDPRVELISADSMQVYRGMDIGTAKPSADEQSAVRHHLIDVADPHDDYTLSTYAAAVSRVTSEIAERGGIAVLVGGTGLYVRAVVDRFEIPGRFPDARAEVEAEPNTSALYSRLTELDPLAASRMEPTNRRRIVRALEVTIGSRRPFSAWGPGVDAYPPVATRQVACDRPRPVLDQRIHDRYDQQMRDGFLDEVRALAASPAGISPTARQALGYRELLRVVEEGAGVVPMLDIARQRTRRFARRQQRWFRRDPRIEWIDLDGQPVDEVAARLAADLSVRPAR